MFCIFLFVIVAMLSGTAENQSLADVVSFPLNHYHACNVQLLYQFCLNMNVIILMHSALKFKLRPNKVKEIFLVLLPGDFLPSESTQTDRQTITKRHYVWKYILKVMLL